MGNNINNFKKLLEQTPKKFKNLIRENIEELIGGIVYYSEPRNVGTIIEIIKLDEEFVSGNILDNLLQLEPFSLPIVDAFIENGYLDKKEDFCYRVDKIRQITSAILDSLTKQKLKIRKDSSAITNIKDSESRLNEVIDELERHENILKTLEKRKEKNNQLKKIKNKLIEIEKELDVKNIQQLNDRLNDYKAKRDAIKNLAQEIISSEKLFKNLPKDNA